MTLTPEQAQQIKAKARTVVDGIQATRWIITHSAADWIEAVKVVESTLLSVSRERDAEVGRLKNAIEVMSTSTLDASVRAGSAEARLQERDAEVERLKQCLADVLTLAGGDVDPNALTWLEEMRVKAERADALEARVTALTEALTTVLDHLPQDAISRTFWDGDDGTIIYHEWYIAARAALAQPVVASQEETK